MASWFPQSATRAQVCRRASPIPPDDRTIVTRNFVYSATPTTTAYPDDTVQFATLEGIDQLVVSGTIPAPNTIIYMPPATALLDLFRNPEIDDQFAIDVSNRGANSVDLTIYKTNAYGTGQAGVAYQNPLRVATVPAYGVVRLYLRVINPTPVTGVADVKMLTTLEGGSSSVPAPSVLFNMGVARAPLVPTINNAQLISQQIVPSIIGAVYQLQMGGTATAPGTILPPAVPAGASCAAFLYPTDRTGVANLAAPPLVSGLAAGQTFGFSLFVSNTSGQTLTWTAGAATGVSFTGISPLAQVTGVAYRVDFLFTIAGVSTGALPWIGSTVSINLTSVGELNPTFTTVSASGTSAALSVTSTTGWVVAPQYRVPAYVALPAANAQAIGWSPTAISAFAIAIPVGAPILISAQAAVSLGTYLATYTLYFAAGQTDQTVTHSFGLAGVAIAPSIQTRYLTANISNITNTAIVSVTAAGAISIFAGSSATGLAAPTGGYFAIARIA